MLPSLLSRDWSNRERLVIAPVGVSVYVHSGICITCSYIMCVFVCWCFYETKLNLKLNYKLKTGQSGYDKMADSVFRKNAAVVRGLITEAQSLEENKRYIVSD